MGVEWKRKGEKGEKWGRKACFSPWAKQSRAMGLILFSSFYLPTTLSLSLSFPFRGTRGVWIESVGRGCGASKCCEALGLSNWWCPLDWSYRDAAVAIGGKVKGKKRRKGVSLLGGIQTACQELPSGFFRWGSSVCPPMGQQFTMLLAAPEKTDWACPLFFSAGLNPPAAVNQSRSPVPSPSVSFYRHLNLPPSAHPLAK